MSKKPVFLALLVSAAWLPGCLGLGSGSAPTRSYVLTALAPPAPQGAAPAGLGRLGVLPAQVPRYLDRPQLVTGPPGNEVVLEDLDRWAEPLAEGITRVLVVNLESHLAGVRVERLPWPNGEEPDLHVRFLLLGLHGSPGGKAVLEARWAIAKPNLGEVLARRTRHEVDLGPGAQGAVVQAWSRLLGNVSAEIAAAIREVPLEKVAR